MLFGCVIPQSQSRHAVRQLPRKAHQLARFFRHVFAGMIKFAAKEASEWGGFQHIPSLFDRWDASARREPGRIGAAGSQAMVGLDVMRCCPRRQFCSRHKRRGAHGRPSSAADPTVMTGKRRGPTRRSGWAFIFKIHPALRAASPHPTRRCPGRGPCPACCRRFRGFRRPPSRCSSRRWPSPWRRVLRASPSVPGG